MRDKRCGIRAALVAALLGAGLPIACTTNPTDEPSRSKRNASMAPDSAKNGITVRYVPDALGTDPNAPIWKGVPAYVVPLRRQEVMKPFGGGAVTELRVQAAHNGKMIAWRVEWKDPTRNDVLSLRGFRDAVALQFPAGLAEVSSPYMGDRENLVNIWQWKADLQRAADDGKNVSPVEDLVAAGFGTLTKQPTQDVLGRGVHGDARWHAVFLRRLETFDRDDARFVPGSRTWVAFAAWDGAAEERDGQKSITLQWLDVAIASAAGAAVEPRRARTFLQQGRYLFESAGCATCHGPGGSAGLKNENYVKGTVTVLHTLADRMFLRDRRSAAQVIRLLEEGKDLTKLSAPPEGVPNFERVLAQYKAVRDVILKGSTAGKADPAGAEPPLTMPSWQGVLTVRDIDALIAYFLRSFPWGEE